MILTEQRSGDSVSGAETVMGTGALSIQEERLLKHIFFKQSILQME